MDIITTSEDAMVEFVTVNVAGAGDPAAENNVMAPVGALQVTPVTRDVSCVTEAPAPDVYPKVVLVFDQLGAAAVPLSIRTLPTAVEARQ